MRELLLSHKASLFLEYKCFLTEVELLIEEFGDIPLVFRRNNQYFFCFGLKARDYIVEEADSRGVDVETLFNYLSNFKKKKVTMRVRKFIKNNGYIDIVMTNKTENKMMLFTPSKEFERVKNVKFLIVDVEFDKLTLREV